MFHRAPKLTRVPCLFALLLGCTLLQPAVVRAVTFDFRSPGEGPPNEYFVPGLTMSDPLVGVTATASWPRFLYQDQYGLGVNNPLDQVADDVRVDGNNPAEMVQLQFTKPVMLDSVTFTRIGSQPLDWAMVFVNTSIVSWSPLPGGTPANTGEYTLDLTGLASNLRVGDVVKFAAWLPTDGFQVASVTVEQAPGAPLPPGVAAGLLMAGTLVALKFRQRWLPSWASRRG